MSSGTPSLVTVTYAPGATPPIPGAPVLPAKSSADWPAQPEDKVLNTTSKFERRSNMDAEAQLNGFDTSSRTPSADGY
jgi:hypothetical protein